MMLEKNLTQEEKKKIGIILVRVRERYSIGQRHAAIAMLINPGYLKSLEEGTFSKIPNVNVLKRMAFVLNLNFEDFIKLFCD